MLRLFQENKSYGVKTIALILCLYTAVHHNITSRTLITAVSFIGMLEKL